MISSSEKKTAIYYFGGPMTAETEGKLVFMIVLSFPFFFCASYHTYAIIIRFLCITLLEICDERAQQIRRPHNSDHRQTGFAAPSACLLSLSMIPLHVSRHCSVFVFYMDQRFVFGDHFAIVEMSLSLAGVNNMGGGDMVPDVPTLVLAISPLSLSFFFPTVSYFIIAIDVSLIARYYLTHHPLMFSSQQEERKRKKKKKRAEEEKENDEKKGRKRIFTFIY